MIRPSMTGQRLAALFLAGCLLLNYPLLHLFAGSAEILDVPVLYVYVFSAWGALIAAMAFVIERGED